MLRSNLVALGLIQLFRLGSGLVVNVLVMRGLGVEGFGVYGYVNILVGLASFASSMGMDRLIKREVARDPESAGTYVATALAASVVLTFVTTAAVLAWTVALDGRTTVIVAAVLASVATGLQAVVLVPVSYFHAIRHMGLGVRGNLFGRLVLVGATAALLWLGYDVLAVFSAQVLDGLVAFAVVWAVYRSLPTPPLRTSGADLRRLLVTSIPFGLNALYTSVYLTVDVLGVQHWWGDQEVGLYRGAVMLLTLVTILADTFTTGIYPRMARHLGDAEATRTELRFVNRVLLALSLPIAVGGFLVAGPLLTLLGGAAFAASAPFFRVMVPMLPLRFLSNGYGMTLTALDRQDDRTRAAAVAAAFNVAANLYALPRHGALGASVTTFLTETVLFLYLGWRVRDAAPGTGAVGTAVRPALAAAAMGGAMLLLPELPVVVTVAVGVVVYAAVGFATGAWHPRDLRKLREV